MRLLVPLLLLLLSGPALAGTLVVTVTTRGPDRQPVPVAGAAVEVWPADAPVQTDLSRSGVVTDDEGRARAPSPEAASIVVVRAEGLAIAWVRTEAGAERASLSLRSAVKLGGIVRHPDGDPVPYASVTIAAERTVDAPAFLRSGEVGFTTICDDTGRFTFSALVPGRRYRLMAAADDFAPGLIRDVEPGLEPVEIRVRTGATVSGRVFGMPGGKPLAGATVRIGPREAVTDTKGVFSVSGVPEGDRVVSVAAAGFLFTGPRRLVLTDGEVRGNLFLKALALGGLDGRVLTPATRPVVGAEILLRYPPGTDLDDLLPADRIVHAGTTGEDGNLRMRELLPAQGVDLVVCHPDFAPTVHLGYSIVAGRVFRAIVFMREGGRISGRVVDAEGAGIAGATVHALDSREDPARIIEKGKALFPTHRQAVTDEVGAFTLTHIPAGRRTLVAVREGILPAVERGVEVGEGAHREHVVLLAGEGKRIVGVVRDPEGRAIPGARVHAEAPLGLKYVRTTAADGSFEFAGLPAGRFRMRAEAEGFAASTGRVVEAPAVEVAIVLRPGLALVGHVHLEDSSEPVAPAHVRILRRSESSPLSPLEPGYAAVRETRAEPPDARFTAGNLDPGVYRIEAWTDEGRFGYRDGIRIVAGEAPKPVIVRVATGWSIRGRVVSGRNGQPMEGATIALRSAVDQPGPHRATSDGQGRFRIDGVPAGFHSLLVVARGLAPRLVASVEVRTAADTVLDDIVLDEGSEVSGTVTDSSAGPRAGVRIVLESAELGGRREAATDETGKFVFENVAAGTYLLIAHESFTGRFARRQERLVTVKRGQDLVIGLGTGKGSVLMGRITSAGAPVPHASVQAILATRHLEKRRQVVTTKADAEGNYVFTDLPVGEHLLTVKLPWSGSNPVRFGARVLPGPVTIRDLILPDSGIEGNAFDLDTGDPLSGVVLRLTRDAGGAAGTFLASLTREMGEVTSNATGSFRFAALPPGEYLVDAFRDGYGQTRLGAIRVLPGGFTPVRIEMPPAGALSGRVVDDRDRPVTAARVRFLDAEGQVVTRRPWYPVDDRGRFRISELRTGTYRVEASAPGYARVEEPEAEVFPGGGVELTLRLEIEGRLELTVYGEGGVLLAGARVSLTDFWGRAVPFPKPKAEALTPYRDPALTGDDGRVLVRNLPPGIYTVTADRHGFAGPAVRVRVLDGELSRGALVLLPVK